MPTISVVTSLYNHARYVRESIQSVMKQTFTDWEMVIVDDASTDNPYPVIKPFLSDGRISYTRLKKNSGPSAGRNVAISLSKGDFITFLDADDMLTKKSLARRLSLLKSSEETLWVHGRAKNLIDGKMVADRDFHSLYLKFSKNMPKPITEYSKAVHSNSVLVRKEFYEKLGLFDEDLRYGEEQDMWKRALAFGYMPKYVEKFVCIYRHHPKQTRFAPGARDLKSRCFAMSAKRLKIRLRDGINESNTKIWKK